MHRNVVVYASFTIRVSFQDIYLPAYWGRQIDITRHCSAPISPWIPPRDFTLWGPSPKEGTQIYFLRCVFFSSSIIRLHLRTLLAQNQKSWQFPKSLKELLLSSQGWIYSGWLFGPFSLTEMYLWIQWLHCHIISLLGTIKPSVISK